MSLRPSRNPHARVGPTPDAPDAAVIPGCWQRQKTPSAFHSPALPHLFPRKSLFCRDLAYGGLPDQSLRCPQGINPPLPRSPLVHRPPLLNCLLSLVMGIFLQWPGALWGEGSGQTRFDLLMPRSSVPRFVQTSIDPLSPQVMEPSATAGFSCLLCHVDGLLTGSGLWVTSHSASVPDGWSLYPTLEISSRHWSFMV